MNAHTARHTISTRSRRAATRAATLLVVTLILLAAIPALADARPARGRASWAPDLDRKIIPTRVQRLGNQLATWYGPGFFGHGTACGGKLTPQTFGIAHRTLPCGTLVHLSYRGRSIAVRVIDRGPFSGASIDLTSRTKYYLRFQSGNVKMNVIKRYRALPNRVVGTFSSSH